MTQEEKELLLKDLCARLPYGVKINIRNDYTLTMEDMELNAYHLTTASYDIEYRGLRPYLRPMSSMAEEEEAFVYNGHIEFWIREDYCNEHHLDFRGLIPMGLALEAPDNMYKQ